MQFVSIASGSSGNCIFVGSDTTSILVDAGISNKRIEQGLNEIGRKGSELGVPIYGTKETLDEITKIKSLGEFPRELLHPIQPDADFSVGDLEIRPFKIDHDAANPVAYRIQNDHASVAVATDMGHYDQYIIDHLQGLDALLLEANHDVRMLETGPYTYYLKQRILSDHGHLSNDNAGRLLNHILHDRLKQVVLGHLSRENNYEELAYQTVRLEIDQGDHPYKASDFRISVAKRDQMS